MKKVYKFLNNTLRFICTPEKSFFENNGGHCDFQEVEDHYIDQCYGLEKKILSSIINIGLEFNGKLFFLDSGSSGEDQVLIGISKEEVEKDVFYYYNLKSLPLSWSIQEIEWIDALENV